MRSCREGVRRGSDTVGTIGSSPGKFKLRRPETDTTSLAKPLQIRQAETAAPGPVGAELVEPPEPFRADWLGDTPKRFSTHGRGK